MKPTEFLISMFPTVSLQEGNAIENLIDIFENNDIIIPDKYGYDERIKMVYNRKELISDILTKSRKFDYVFLYKNQRGIKYNGRFSTRKSNKSYYKFQFSKNINKKYWKKVFEVSDEVANIVKPRFGVTAMWADEIKSSNFKQLGLLDCMYACTEPTPAKFLPYGPLGVGLRTYFNKEMINLFGREFLLNAPAYIEELEWGGIKMDLVKEPWNTEMDIMFEAWVKVMDYLKKAEVFSEYIFRGEDVMPKIITSEKWENFVKNL